MIVFSVDDDREDREILFSAIQKIDPAIRCFGFDNHKAVLTFLANDNARPDLLFIDYHMPGLNGIQCARRLKRNESLKPVPFIIHSSTTNPVDIAEIENAGMELIPKNLDFFQLVKALQPHFRQTV